jgi:hypothetical protein
MNTKAVVAIAVLAFVVMAPVVIAAEGIEGTWEFKNQMKATMTISKDADGKLAGTWAGQRGESTLSDISFENGTLKFTQTASFGGQEMKTTYEGKVEGTKMTGKGQGRRGEFAFEGALEGEAKTGADAVVGKWSVTVIMSSDKLTITKNADGSYAGKWEGMRGESKISNMKFEGGKLTFMRTIDFNGQIRDSEFEGTVEGDKITGKFSTEGRDREANATRVGATTRPAEEKKPNAGKAEPNEPEPKKPDAGKKADSEKKPDAPKSK